MTDDEVKEIQSLAEKGIGLMKRITKVAQQELRRSRHITVMKTKGINLRK